MSVADVIINLTITEMLPSFWNYGVLQYKFKLSGDTIGSCHSILYRNGLHSTYVSVDPVFRGFQGGWHASKPVDWVPRVGETVAVRVPAWRVKDLRYSYQPSAV